MVEDPTAPDVTYVYEEEDKTLYAKAQFFVDGMKDATVYMDWFVTNETSQSILVDDIQVHLSEYKPVNDLFAFTKTVMNGGADGEVEDHIYYSMLDEANPQKSMEYYGDHTVDDLNEEKLADPVSSHVIIQGDEMDCFGLALGAEKPGIYTFDLIMNYVSSGRKYSTKAKKYQLYIPAASDTGDKGLFDLYNETRKEGRYLYNHIDNHYPDPVKLSRKMDRYVRKLREIFYHQHIDNRKSYCYCRYNISGKQFLNHSVI